jgi:hypothetical protein
VRRPRDPNLASYEIPAELERAFVRARRAPKLTARLVDVCATGGRVQREQQIASFLSERALRAHPAVGQQT